MRGKWSPALAAFLLAAAACSPQCGTRATPVAATSPASSPAPSPSPTPTAPLQISAATFHAGEVGAAYAAVSLAATGGVQPYTWSVASGALPDGVTLGSDGAVSGSPTSAGQFSFTIQATDARGGTASVPGTIGVAGALSASLIPACARACQVEAGCVDACGSFGTLSGGTPPYTYAVNGYIPPNTRLNGLSYAGPFVRPISYWQSTVTVSDSFGEMASLSPIFNVYPHISLSSGSCEGIFTACSLPLQISGGTPGGTPSVKLVAVAQNPNQGCWNPTATTPPAGYSVTVSGGYVHVFVPRPTNGYAAVWTLVLTDQSLCAVNVYCTSAPATATIGIECT